MVLDALAKKSNGAILIGEHEIAAGFHSFCSETLPLLTPACVTVFNRSHGSYLEGFRPVDRELDISTSDLSEPDVLAEVAFELFCASHHGQATFRQVVDDLNAFETAWRRAESSISLHRNVRAAELPSTGSISHRYVLALGRRYDALRELLPFAEAEFSPRLKGCGVLGVCEADVSVSDTLVEVKTVGRNFSSKDIRQVIIYLALDHLSGARRWSSAILFNPRRAFLVRFNPAEFIVYVSAGKSAAQVYREIEAFLLHRDLLLEHRF
jgi:hypothetical protein